MYSYILPPIIGAFIGYLTNYVAIKLLFRPHKPISILGFTIQGLIPKRREEIARSIAHTIERELISSKDIASVLDAVNWKEDVEKAVEGLIEHRFSASKIKKIPLLGLVSENLIYHIKYIITRDILEEVEKKKPLLLKRVTENVDVKGLLTDRIDRLDLERFEDLLTNFIAKELRYIEILGGVMGFIIGVAQSGLVYLVR